MDVTTNTDPLAELRTTATVSVPFACTILGISKAHGYNMVKEGRLPVIRLGEQRVRVISAALLRMLEDSAA